MLLKFYNKMAEIFCGRKVRKNVGSYGYFDGEVELTTQKRNQVITFEGEPEDD